MTLRGPLSDRFELRDALGEGGMGVVHRAWDRTLDKEIAIKRVRDLGPREVQRLKSEFRARRALQHRNLVQRQLERAVIGHQRPKFQGGLGQGFGHS